MTSQPQITPGETSLLYINELIGQLEHATDTYTANAKPTVVALINQVHRAGDQHYKLFGGAGKEFRAMFARYSAAKATGAGAIARTPSA